MAGGWCFAIVTDTHVGASYGDYGGPGPDDRWGGQDYYLTDRLSRTVEWLNANAACENIRFVAVLGDITQSAEESEYLKAKEILDRLSVPYVPLLGNHDVWPYTDDEGSPVPNGSCRFNAIFASTFESLACSAVLTDWKKDAGVASETPVMNYAFSVDDTRFVVLDLVSRHSPIAGPGVEGKGVFHPATCRFLQERLAESGAEPVIVLSHHPLTGKMEKPDGVSEAQWVAVRAMIALSVPSVEDCDAIARTLAGHNVPASFAGHIHSIEFVLGHIPAPPFIWDFNHLEFEPIGATRSCVTEGIVAGSNGPDGEDKGTIRLVRVGPLGGLDWTTVNGEQAPGTTVALNPSFNFGHIDGRFMFVPHRFTIRDCQFMFDFGDGTTSGGFEDFKLGWEDRVNLLDASYHKYDDGEKPHVVRLIVRTAAGDGQWHEEEISRVVI